MFKARGSYVADGTVTSRNSHGRMLARQPCVAVAVAAACNRRPCSSGGQVTISPRPFRRPRHRTIPVRRGVRAVRRAGSICDYVVAYECLCASAH
eukprot:364965-Chlamydomonas_euryale.AAC.37